MPFSRPEFRALFDAEKDRLYRFLVHVTGNFVEAEDLVQETFLTVWRKRDQYAGRGSAAGYLRSTAFRLYLNAREREKRRADLAPRDGELKSCGEPADEALAESDARSYLVQRVRDALRHLRPETREAFVLHRFEGLTCNEIAELVGAPAKTVEGRIARATHELARRLRPLSEHLSAS